MAWSAAAFRSVVWPAISRWCGGGKIEQVEGRDRSMLDMYAGIDAWQVFGEDKAMRGIASRIQFDTGNSKYPYDTFSIRVSRPTCPTEYAKRLAAILSDRGMVWPHLTVQAYLNSAKKAIRSVAVVKTRDLYTFVDARGLESFATIMNKDRSSEFIAVAWDILTGNGVQVKIARSPPHDYYLLIR
jgi:hypothetical protein